jgi:hypothetical protein
MKTIQINDHKKIVELQKEFNEAFPFLRLEFFRHKHMGYQASSKKDLLSSDLTLKQSSKQHHQGAIVLKESMKVSELEELFRELFGLSVQVFRKSGRSWIETTVTDDWTLERQNEEGRQLSSLNGFQP